jgi:hypothetical protein
MHIILRLLGNDRATARRAADETAELPVGAALTWAALLATGLTVIAAAVLIGGNQ